MRAGDLDRQIVIEQNTPTRTAAGGLVDSWSTLATVQASKRDMGGNEVFAGGQVQAKIDTGFKIRHRTDVTTAMRISYNGEIYDIQAIKELGRAEGLEIFTTAQVS